MNIFRLGVVNQEVILQVEYSFLVLLFAWCCTNSGGLLNRLLIFILALTSGFLGLLLLLFSEKLLEVEGQFLEFNPL